MSLPWRGDAAADGAAATATPPRAREAGEHRRGSQLHPADLQPAFGLDLLAPATTGYAGSLLRSVNLFSVWGAGLNGIGIATTHRTSKTTGYGAAAVAFVMIVLLLSLLALLQPQA